ncbi:hypothetical protein GCM10027280_26010 [Micromonospora polyrhachis]|uniref:RNA ligase n=1 Tax=Micromonospora polyrhachis TaxID=1282883 RepID=A0A7W7SSV2_9ACTN|nr:RNA ligase [Micromonospora polyrhachis]MBB4960308.1 RNA ligase [Micromonospora polyrhachis]
MTTPVRTSTPRLTDVLDATALADALAAGHVRVQRHPEHPLSIYNYTEACTYGQFWTPVTTTCRGLIVDDRTEMVLARPFAKFFNHDQPGAPTLRIDAPVTVTDKADGSLGILYPDPEGGFAVATRGSFASTQAEHATAVLRNRYPDFAPPAGLTVLVEIVYPANRIVLDYGGLDDLVLLGAVEIASGRTHGPEAVSDWPGPVVDQLDHATFAEALAAPPRDNREGLVVHCRETDQRVKIKYADYLRLHRLVTGLTARSVWDVLVNGGDLAALVEPLPDEFHTWVREVVATLTATVEERVVEIETAYQEIVAALPEGWTRREFAQAVHQHPDRGQLFLRLDGKDVRPLLWQRVRPAPEWTPYSSTSRPDPTPTRP